jgi:hypothetical protein
MMASLPNLAISALRPAGHHNITAALRQTARDHNPLPTTPRNPTPTSHNDFAGAVTLPADKENREPVAARNIDNFHNGPPHRTTRQF